MITIEEKSTAKLPGLTSLFVSFKYDPKIVDILKSFQSGIYNKDTKEWEFSISYLSKLIDELTLFDDIELDIQKQELKEDVHYELHTYKTKPFEHQIEAIEYGLNHNKWLLLDPPGLGKSATALWLSQELKLQKGIKHCLIICGVNTLKSNWKNEVYKHTDLDCKILGEYISSRGNLRYGGIDKRLEQLKSPIEEFFVITNIETLRDSKITKELNNGKNKFDLIIFDELHQAKSPTSQQGKNLLKLTNAKYKLGMTGTILTNSPLDCYVPLKWIGLEKSNYSNYKYNYCVYSGPFNNIISGYKNLDILKHQLETCSLRRPKSLLKLPPKNIIKEYIDMDNSQLLFYDNIKQGIADQVDKIHLDTANILSLTTRLRQATACPQLLTSEPIQSTKVNRCCDLTEEIISNGEKVVIFSTFKQPVDYIADKLKKYNPLVCTGDIASNIRDENIYKFQNDDNYKIIICTWQTMGTGITLTTATSCIFIDTPWTAAATEQCQDRIYRIGTQKPVFIYHLITKDTIDERVQQLIEDKSAMSDYIVDDVVTEKTVDNLKKYILDL